MTSGQCGAERRGVERVVIAHVGRHTLNPLQHALDGIGRQLFVGQLLLDGLLHVGTKLRQRHAAPGGANDAQTFRQQPVAVQVIQRWPDHASRQIAVGAKDDHGVR
jgi:hypothetical protein